MKNTKQVAQKEVNNLDSSNIRTQRLLRKRARERTASSRWNINSLILVYVNLVVVIILTLKEVDFLITGLVAVFGLVLVWLSSWLQLKKLESKIYEEELRNYTELSYSEYSNESDEDETSNSVGSAESPLTLRELDILEQMAKGSTNKEIAYALQISAQTVKNHIAHIFWKLDVSDRTSAVLTAMHEGWIKDKYTELSRSTD